MKIMYLHLEPSSGRCCFFEWGLKQSTLRNEMLEEDISSFGFGGYFGLSSNCFVPINLKKRRLGKLLYMLYVAYYDTQKTLLKVGF